LVRRFNATVASTANALASRSDGLVECGLEALIGCDQLRVIIRRGNRRLCYQLVLLLGV
jgi:hypothetical protein